MGFAAGRILAMCVDRGAVVLEIGFYWLECRTERLPHGNTIRSDLNKA